MSNSTSSTNSLLIVCEQILEDLEADEHANSEVPCLASKGALRAALDQSRAMLREAPAMLEALYEIVMESGHSPRWARERARRAIAWHKEATKKGATE